VHERLDDAELLAVALGELSDGALERDAEPLDELVTQAPVDPSTKAGQGLELFAGGQAVVETKVARQVADAPADVDAVRPAVPAKQRRTTGCRADEVEKQADRRAFARPVRTEKAEDLSLLDAQVESDQSLRAALCRSWTDRGSRSPVRSPFAPS
jgi:hypothetical protein